MSDTRNHTTRDQLAEAIRESWHEGGFYGRADLAPGWLDGFATVTADALEPYIAAVRAAAVAETTAAIEGILADWEALAGYGVDAMFRGRLRAALSGGRTAPCSHPHWEEEGDESGSQGVWVCTTCGEASSAAPPAEEQPR